ncbi:MAG: Sun protein [Sandaracinus sp.]|nr:Sun protein [Sandaracinus sp.]MCB9624514.1 Sun protein [Sandaracinus sp.]MCB9635479.1 Sun protein [Sandaracinus sp.]
MSQPAKRARPRRRASARSVATEVLFRVATDGAWATPTLDAALSRSGLDARDAALATSLVYGTLRVLPSLDAALDAHLKKAKKLDAWVRAAMRVAAFQIRHLPRIPVAAAVDEAVAIVRADRDRLASVANAVLRKIRRPDDAEPPTRLEVPTWIAGALHASLGERAPLFLEARSLPPPLDLRVRSERDELARAIAEARPDAEIEPGVGPATLHVRRAGDPRQLPGFAEGRFVVQEQGSQLLGVLADARPGEVVLDACAGHGGKTLQLLEAVGDEGVVFATDLHESRLDRGERERERLGLANRVTSVPIDWTVGDGGLGDEPEVAARGGFDRVLVDAPCSGLGTVHRRPEMLLRLQPEDVDALATTQRAILDRVASLVRPGGVLVYAVCSPLDAEGAAVARSFDAAHPTWRREPLRFGEETADASTGVLRIGPWVDGSDGYQITSWRREG